MLMCVFFGHELFVQRSELFITSSTSSFGGERSAFESRMREALWPSGRVSRLESRRSNSVPFASSDSAFYSKVTVDGDTVI